MEVDFDSLRKQLIQEYNALVKHLNSRTICPTVMEQPSPYNKKGDVNTIHGNILLHVQDVKERLDNIASLLWNLACCYNGADANDISNDVSITPFKPSEL